jgi:hypothetical protein
MIMTGIPGASIFLFCILDITIPILPNLIKYGYHSDFLSQNNSSAGTELLAFGNRSPRNGDIDTASAHTLFLNSTSIPELNIDDVAL